MNEPNDLLSMQLPSGSLWLPEAAALSTPAVDDPFWLIYWTCVVAFVLVVVPMFYFMWRYRRKTADQRAESQVDHNQLMEIAWSAIPTVFFVIIFVWGFRGFLDLQTAPANAMELRVTGQKWFWTVKYPDQGVTVSGQGAELVVPIDQPVKLVMTSTDVLHSYFVPNFRVKQDVIPWRYTTLWFQPTKIGTYPVFCTEYCGKNHSSMLARIKVVTREEFDAWAEEQSAAQLGDPTVERGLEVYNAVCLACHSVDGSARVGPSFKGLYGSNRPFTDGTSAVADDDYLLESILEPNKKIVQGYPPAMPPMGGTLNQTQLESVILYIKSVQ
jgi:cytochrome c oxidase subunit II